MHVEHCTYLSSAYYFGCSKWQVKELTLEALHLVLERVERGRGREARLPCISLLPVIDSCTSSKAIQVSPSPSIDMSDIYVTPFERSYPPSHPSQLSSSHLPHLPHQSPSSLRTHAMTPPPTSPTRPSPSDLQSHLYASFLQRKTADVALRISGSWHAVYKLHRVVLIQAVRNAPTSDVVHNSHPVHRASFNRSSHQVLPSQSPGSSAIE